MMSGDLRYNNLEIPNRTGIWLVWRLFLKDWWQDSEDIMCNCNASNTIQYKNGTLPRLFQRYLMGFFLACNVMAKGFRFMPLSLVKRQKLDYSVRQAIAKLHDENNILREISEKVKRSKSVVGRVVKSYNDTGKIVSAVKKNGLKLVSRIVKNWFVLVVEDVQLSLRARAHLLNIDCTCIFIVFWLFTLFFSILSLTFGRSKFENK